ncbi:hypothetical protein MHYP_G00239150 [Metynnis hypsauchen]
MQRSMHAIRFLCKRPAATSAAPCWELGKECLEALAGYTSHNHRADRVAVAMARAVRCSNESDGIPR